MDISLSKLLLVLFVNVFDEDKCCLMDNEVFLVFFVKFEEFMFFDNKDDVFVCVILYVGNFEIMILMVGLIDVEVELVCIVK